MGNVMYLLRGPQPTGSVEGLKLEEIRARLTSTSPEKVATAGHAYHAASGKLTAAQQELDEAISYLGDRWHGPAADEARAALTKLRKTAAGLASTSQTTGKALRQYGEKILPWYKSHLPGDGYIRTGSDDEYAQKFMKRLNTRIAQTYTSVPGELEVDLPGIGRNHATASTNFGESGSAGNGRTYTTPQHSPLSVSGESGSYSPAPDQGSAKPQLSPDAGVPGADLASVPGVLGSSPGTGIPHATPVGGMGMGGTAAQGGLQPLALGTGMHSPVIGGGGRGVSQGGSTSGGRGARVGPAGHAGQTPHVIGGHGPGGRADERERERSTWLAEDRDIWGSDTEESVSPVIGEMGPVVRAETRTDHIGHSLQQAEDDSRNPKTLDVPQEKIDRFLDDLEAKLDLELVDLSEEAHDDMEDESPSPDDDLDDLLGELVDDDADAGGDPHSPK